MARYTKKFGKLNRKIERGFKSSNIRLAQKALAYLSTKKVNRAKPITTQEAQYISVSDKQVAKKIKAAFARTYKKYEKAGYSFTPLYGTPKGKAAKVKRDYEHAMKNIGPAFEFASKLLSKNNQAPTVAQVVENIVKDLLPVTDTQAMKWASAFFNFVKSKRIFQQNFKFDISDPDYIYNLGIPELVELFKKNSQDLYGFWIYLDDNYNGNMSLMLRGVEY